MIRSRLSVVRVAVGVIAVALALMLPFGTGSVSAQPADEPAPFDMTTDNDGNGIPDEFENAYNELERTAGQAGGASGSSDNTAMDRFVERIPVAQDTLNLKSQIDATYRTYQETSSPERQQALLRQIQDLADQMARDDPVHAAALRYFDMLGTQDTPAPAGPGGASSHRDIQDYVDEINQPGDVLFIRLRGVTPAWLWTMNWSHVGMYDGGVIGVRQRY